MAEPKSVVSFRRRVFAVRIVVHLLALAIYGVLPVLYIARSSGRNIGILVGAMALWFVAGSVVGSLIHAMIEHLFDRYCQKVVRRRRMKGFCSQCGYDLRGLDGGRCPECGAP